MLETLFEHPFSLKLHRKAPLLKERETSLHHLQQQGTSRAALQEALCFHTTLPSASVACDLLFSFEVRRNSTCSGQDQSKEGGKRGLSYRDQ